VVAGRIVLQESLVGEDEEIVGRFSQSGSGGVRGGWSAGMMDGLWAPVQA
jgi:hypothetical protein